MDYGHHNPGPDTHVIGVMLSQLEQIPLRAGTGWGMGVGDGT